MEENLPANLLYWQPAARMWLYFLKLSLSDIHNSPYNIYVDSGGRYSGKSWRIAQWLVRASLVMPNKLTLCAKGTMRSLDQSVKNLLAMTITRLKWDVFFDIKKKEIVCKISGSSFTFIGLQHPERIKSFEGIDFFWLEEAVVDVSSEALEVVLPTVIRKPGALVFISFNPRRKEDAVYQKFIVNKFETAYVRHTTYKDNYKLDKSALTYIESVKKESLTKYNHYFGGELEDLTANALWKEGEIKHDFINNLSEIETVFIGVDPSGTANQHSDECGIIVVGKHWNGKVYVLEDASAIMRPKEWARTIVQLFFDYQADGIVIEKNGVGESSPDLLGMVSPGTVFNIDMVTAKREEPTPGIKGAKLARASLTHAMYAEGLIYHSQTFAHLEYEMLNYTGELREKSPNRIDALVYATKPFTEGNYEYEGESLGSGL